MTTEDNERERENEGGRGGGKEREEGRWEIAKNKQRQQKNIPAV